MQTITATGTELAVCRDIEARQQVGIAKYGTTVADNPLALRQWLQHAYEETLDHAIYLRLAIDELDKEATIVMVDYREGFEESYNYTGEGKLVRQVGPSDCGYEWLEEPHAIVKVSDDDSGSLFPMRCVTFPHNANKCRRSADENLNRSQPMNDAQKLDKAAYGGSPGMTCSASSVPDQCPKCGIERAEGWVHGYRGWKCGTYWQSNSDSTNQLKQSIECAVTHWKKRALKAEWLLSLITPPNDRLSNRLDPAQ